MHPSSEIFIEIQALWREKAISSLPAFFSRIDQQWERVPVGDLEAFYEHVNGLQPEATAILTTYTVREKPMIVAHYEAPHEACHRVWAVAEDGSLIDIYEAPVETTGLFLGSIRAA